MFSKASISQVLLSRLELHDGAGTGGGISEESKRAMTPTVWRPYPDRVRSSHWYELFADAQGDKRSRLTWKGLFRDVDNTVNFYSTRDEVVANDDGSRKWPMTILVGGDKTNSVPPNMSSPLPQMAGGGIIQRGAASCRADMAELGWVASMLLSLVCLASSFAVADMKSEKSSRHTDYK